METLFLQHVLLIQGQNADLRTQDQSSVVHHVISRRSQAVPVKDGAHHVAVREQNGGRTVPGLHHRRIILIEISLLLGNGVIVLPRLGNGDHGRKRQLHAAHHKEFQSIIQHRGIRSALRDHGEHARLVLTGESGSMHGLLACKHLIRIALNGVDLTIVYHETVRMRAIPARRRVRRKTRMHHGNGRFIILILKIQEEGAKLSHQEHALVYDGTAGQGRNVSADAALLKLSSDDVKLSVKGKIRLGLLRALNKHLADPRHALTRTGAKYVRRRLHVSPSQDL